MPRVVGNAYAAAEVDDRGIGEARREIREEAADLGPILDVEYAAARVRVQAGDRTPRVFASATSSSISGTGMPNLEYAPAVRTC